MHLFPRSFSTHIHHGASTGFIGETYLFERQNNNLTIFCCIVSHICIALEKNVLLFLENYISVQIIGYARIIAL